MKLAPRYFQMLVSPHVGGGAKLAMQLHDHAVKNRGTVSELLLPGGGEAERLALRARYPFHKYRVDRLTGRSRATSLLENLNLCRKVLRRPRGIVHVHAPFVYGAARVFFAASGLRTVLHVHLDFTPEQLKWALRVPPDLILVCASFMRRAVEDAVDARHLSDTRIEVLRNAVDLGQFRSRDRQQAKQALGIGSRPLLMMVANLAPHKGQETAIRAVATLRDRGHDVGLWIVGGERADGSGHLALLRAVVDELKLQDRVEFAGFRNDIPDLLAAADFLLLPSTSEGLPLVILEAQASRSIVLAAPTAGIPEVIEHGRTGFLIPARDHCGYAEHIARLLREPAQAQSVTEAAYRHVHAQHALGSYCDRVLQHYDSLLALN